MDLEQKRQVVLAFLCGLSEQYIKKSWRLSKTIRKGNILSTGLAECFDHLVEFYSLTKDKDRKNNAVHIYLAFNKRSDDLIHVDLVNKNRDRPVFEAVTEEIFAPIIERLIKEVNLEKIISSHPFSPKENLLRVIFGAKTSTYNLSWGKINTLVCEELRAAYDQEKNIDLNKVFNKVADKFFSELKLGLSLVENPKIIDYLKYLEREEQRKFKKMRQQIFKKLNNPEKRVLKAFFKI